jgi:hypothetical protein
MPVKTEESKSSSNEPVAIDVTNTAGAALILGVSQSVLIRWRWERKGPTYIRLAQNLIRYRVSDLVEFLDRHKVRPL